MTVIDEKSSPVKTFESNDNEIQASKLLGLIWDSCSDCFKYDFSALLQCAQPTKWALLHITAKIFDPLQLLSPFIILLKMMFQQLCVDGKDLDTEIFRQSSGEVEENTDRLNCAEVTRYYHGLSNKPVSIELHGFSVASVSTYVVVLYIRICFEVDVKIIASKTKVTPIKQHTIPRLELMAALLLPQLVSSTSNALPFTASIHCWTNSTCILYWIQNNKPWK